MNYNQYLFSCLLKIYSLEFEQLEYDLQYEKVFELYKEFEDSKFNIYTKGEYDCIEDYLKDKYYDLYTNRKLKLIDLNLSTRLYNVLKQENIYTLGELEKQEIADLFKIKNFGKICLFECESLLKKYNLKSLYVK